MAYRGIATMRKRLIGSKLRKLREESAMTIETVATHLGVSNSVIYRQETGHTATSVADCNAYLSLYGITDEATVKRMLELARACRVRGWWFEYSETAGEEHVNLADIEDLSTEFRTVNLTGFHALLETEEFARATLEASRAVLGADFHMDDVLALRRRRRDILDREDPPKMWAIVGEASLKLEFDDPGIMLGQVNHLRYLMESPNISIQILPASSLGNLVVEGFMSVMGFDGTPDGSVVHTYRSFSDHPDQVKKDLHRFTYMQTNALSQAETRNRLDQLAAELRQAKKENE